jgi:hypothetical protein
LLYRLSYAGQGQLLDILFVASFPVTTFSVPGKNQQLRENPESTFSKSLKDSLRLRLPEGSLRRDFL